MKKKNMKTMKKKPGPAEDMKKIIAELRGRQKALEKENRALRDRQTKLEASLSAYSELCENAPAGYVSLDREGRILQANRTASRLLGSGKESLLKKRFHAFVLKEDQDILTGHLRKVFRTKQEILCDIRMGNKRNAFRYARLRSIIVKDRGTRRNIAITTISDITVLKQAQQALEESEEKYRILVESSMVGFVIFDKEKVRYVNPAVEEMLGTSIRKLTTLPLKKTFELVHPEDRAYVLGNIRNRLSGKPAPSRYALRIMRKDGKVLWLEASASLFHYHGKPAIHVVFVDITENKKTEERLVESEARYRHLIESSPMTIMVHHKEKTVYVNPETVKMLGGNSPADFLGRSIMDFVHSDFREAVSKRIKRIYEKKVATIRMEQKLIRLDGEVIDTEAIGSPVMYEGKPSVQVILNDITERKRTEKALRDSEENFKALAENASDAILIADGTGKHVYANKRAAELTGYSVTEILRTSIKDLAHPDETGELMQQVKKRTAGIPVKREYETRIVRKDGRIIPIEVTSARTVWEGQPAGMVVVRDIAERKRAEEKLRESEEKYRNLIDYSLQGVLVIQDNRIVFSNPAHARISGYTVKELTSLSAAKIRDMIHPEDRASVWGNMPKRLAGEKIPSRYDLRIIRKDGTVRWLEVFSTLITLNGKPAIQTTTVDITERKLAEKTVEERLQFEKLVSGISSRFINLQAGQVDRVVEDGLGRIGAFFDVEQVSFGRYFAEKKGFLISHRWKSVENNSGTDRHAGKRIIILPKLLSRLRKHGSFMFENLAQIPGHWKAERQFIKKIGTRATVLVGLNVGGEFMGIIVLDALKAKRAWPDNTARNLKIVGEIFANAISRKDAAEALAESEEKFRAIFENAKDGFLLLDMETKTFQSGNRMIRRMLNASLEKIKKMSIEDILLKKDAARVTEQLKNQLQGEAALDKDLQIGRKRGRTFYASLSAFPITLAGRVSMVLVMRDITEKKIIEDELLKTDKLESVGKLAGGIAHDFNNILTGILGNITMARMFVKPEERAFKHLERAEKASWRGQNLTQQLLTFSKGGAPIKKVVFPGDLIMESARFASAGSNIACRFDIPEDLWPVEADEGQISQVINNLVINADQAMPAGGEVLFHAENITLPGRSKVALKAGSYLKIIVQDQGIGIPKKYHSRVFDPYFTTKQKGSGLGLTTAYSILKNHDGLITLTSRQGKGTSFTIYLPAFREKMPRQKDREGEPIRGEGRILVLDDDPAVSEVVQSMLRNLGYEVELSTYSKDAIALFRNARKTGRPFAAVILDLTMPGDRGGKAVIRDLRKIDPDVRGIVSSGYSDDPVLANFRAFGFRAALAKPFRTSHLGKALQQAIKGTGK